MAGKGFQSNSIDMMFRCIGKLADVIVLYHCAQEGGHDTEQNQHVKKITEWMECCYFLLFSRTKRKNNKST